MRPLHQGAVTAACSCGGDGGVATGGKDRLVVLSQVALVETAAAAATAGAGAAGGATGVTCSGHGSEVTALHWAGPSPAAPLFSASRDKLVKQWDLGTGREVQSFAGHSLAVTGLATTSDGAAVVAGSRSGTLIRWDVGTGAVLRETHVSRNVVTSLVRIPSTELLLQGSEDKMLRIWDAATLGVVHTFPRGQYFHTCCDAAEDGKTLLTGSNGFNGSGCLVAVWDRRKLDSPVERRPGHLQGLAACAFIPGGASGGGGARGLRYCTSATDGTVKLWRVREDAAEAAVDLQAPGAAQAMAVWHDGRGGGGVVVGGVSGAVAVLRTAEGLERVGHIRPA